MAAVEGFWKGGSFDTRSNVQFGEGGAGTFSDGKLTTRINDPLCETVLEIFAAHGADPSILKKAKPHIGTDYLRRVVKSIREEIIRLGGEVRFNTQVTGFSTQSGRITAVRTEAGEVPGGNSDPGSGTQRPGYLPGGAGSRGRDPAQAVFGGSAGRASPE